MDKLEEQLRNSRRKERPDLRPPAGGWEAVQAGLVAAAAAAATGAAAGKAAAATKAGAGTAAVGTAAAGATTAATTATATAATVTAATATAAKASLAALITKAIIGVTVLGGVVAGGYAIATNDAGEDAAEATTINNQAPATQPAAPDLLPGETPPTSQPEGAQLPELDAAGTTANPALNDATTPPLQQTVSPNPRTKQAAPLPEIDQLPPARSSEVSDPDNRPATQRSSDSPGAENTTPAGPVSQAGGGAPAPTSSGPPPTVLDSGSPQTAAPGVDPAVTPVLPAAPDTSTRLPGFAVLDEAAEEETDRFTDEPVTSEAGRDETAAEVAPVAIANINIPARAVPIPGTEPVPFALEAEVVPEEVRFGKFRRPDWAAWQVHGGANVLIGRRDFGFSQNAIFERTTNSNPNEQITLETGEVVNLTSSTVFLDSKFFSENVTYRLGVTRQTHWGGALRATLNHYRSSLKERDFLPDLGPDEVFLQVSESERATFLDLEFQYTLFRRHRLRPFFGLGAITASTYRYRETENFFDNQSGTTVQRPRQERSVAFSMDPDLTFSLGFQYQVSTRLSLGGQLYGNSGTSDILLETPFGLEARYTLK